MGDLGLLVAVAVDGLAGEIGGRWHPVALAGRLLEAAYRPWRGRGPALELGGGAAALAAVTALAAALGAGAARLAGRRRAGALLTGVALKQTLSVRRLLEEGGGVAAALERGRVAEARRRLRALVSRPTGALDAEQCASAAIESLAENVADSVAGPLLCYALLGLPAAAAYRVVNTADAMFGYRGETEWLGKAAARLDDALNWAPSRLSALALTGAALALRGPRAAAAARRAWRRDGGRTASPNAGRPMAAMAGALGRRLEKPGHYVLGGELPPPGPADVREAVRLAGAAVALLAAAALLLAAARGPGR
jgi:adenosylcobinamide-phosphate synthase